MCAILGVFDIRDDPKPLRQQALRLSRRQRHRGPDWSGIFSDERAILVHERLAIVDLVHGAQPLYDSERWRDYAAVKGKPVDPDRLRSSLEAAVERNVERSLLPLIQ